MNDSTFEKENISDNRFHKLTLPPVNLKVTRSDGIIKVFDPLRQKLVALTPEEFVRQHFVAWLMSAKGYPSSLLANELSLHVNGRRRRCDTVAFSPEGETLLIVEYKAPTVDVTQDVFDQIVRYNMALRSRYLVVSNGIRHYCCSIDYKTASYQFVADIPAYQSLRGYSCDN